MLVSSLISRNNSITRHISFTKNSSNQRSILPVYGPREDESVLCQSDQLSEVKICQGILWGALKVREQCQQSDNNQGENINTTLSQPIICTVRKNIMARFLYVKIIKWNVNKFASRLYVYAPKME
jgi:hypothetical protein